MNATEDRHWWVYMVECEDGALYTGITNHLLRRWQQHNSGRGAKFFNSRKPARIAWLEYPHDKRSAARREYQIKQLNRAQKLALLKTQNSAC